MLVAFLTLLAFLGLLGAKCAENVECAKEENKNEDYEEMYEF